MTLRFDTTLADSYSSKSQKIRVMSEYWVSQNMYCPCCGNPHIDKLENNSPVADMQCDYCGEIFELKAKEGNVGKKINDGSYYTMIERITSSTNPDLFVLSYSTDYYIISLTMIPKFFFVPQIIEKRKPLAPHARRAGWTGCNILYSNIPEQGKIDIIQNSQINTIEDVTAKYRKIKQLQTKKLDSRGWLLDVLNCVNEIPSEEFTLNDVYKYVDLLHQKHIHNNNVEAKIRQQLQFLRDKGFIQFLGRGRYRKCLS